MTEKATNQGQEVIAPLSGNFYLTKEASETPVKEGDVIKEGDVLGYIEAMKTYNTIRSDQDGIIASIIPANGEEVFEDDALFTIR